MSPLGPGEDIGGIGLAKTLVYLKSSCAMMRHDIPLETYSTSNLPSFRRMLAWG